MAADFGTMTVFLVEPSAVQAGHMTHLLGSRGIHSVQRFESGAAALAAMREAPPHLVISALYLPDLQGTDLIQQMRADPLTEHTPFILVSSETRPQVLEPVRQNGACGILPKPFTSAQLETALRSTLDYLDTEAGEQDALDLSMVKVLIVDDSRSARMFMRRTMENLGVRNFTEAADGSEAVAYLADTAFDLVVTDYNMPEMDGQALLNYIRNKSWQSSVPVLMVTSESDEGRLAAVEEAGVSGICDKPFDSQTVRALLTRMLRTGE